MSPPRPGATRRVWTLLHDGLQVGTCTEHSGRTFAVGDMLRDDDDARRQVVSVQNDGVLAIGVSRPDVIPEVMGIEIQEQQPPAG